MAAQTLFFRSLRLTSTAYLRRGGKGAPPWPGARQRSGDTQVCRRGKVRRPGEEPPVPGQRQRPSAALWEAAAGLPRPEEQVGDSPGPGPAPASPRRDGGSGSGGARRAGGGRSGSGRGPGRCGRERCSPCFLEQGGRPQPGRDNPSRRSLVLLRRWSHFAPTVALCSDASHMGLGGGSDRGSACWGNWRLGIFRSSGETSCKGSALTAPRFLTESE